MKQAQDSNDNGFDYNTMANKSLDWTKLLTRISNSTETKV